MTGPVVRDKRRRQKVKGLDLATRATQTDDLREAFGFADLTVDPDGIVLPFYNDIRPLQIGFEGGLVDCHNGQLED